MSRCGVRELGLFGLILVISVTLIVGPPVDQKKNAKEPEKHETDNETLNLNLEYERYLQEVVQILESDPDFKGKLEKANPDDIKSGKIATELDFVNKGIRSKLDEAKRREIERLREVIKKQIEVQKGAHGVKIPKHLDHINMETFEKSDLEKLIVETTKDLEELDKQRQTEFKNYEMEKEIERRIDLVNLTAEERGKAEKEHEAMEKKHAEHPKVHHPGGEEQLKEVWEDVDNMPKEDFDMRTFFNLHDLTGDGYLDEAELEALFQKELDKVYDKNAKEDDMQEREEEEARMRKHVQEEMDTNKDGLISLEEFLGEQKDPNFKEDPAWETVEDKPVYTEEELKMWEEHMRQIDPNMPAYIPPYPQDGQQVPHYPPGQHQQQQQAYQQYPQAGGQYPPPQGGQFNPQYQQQQQYQQGQQQFQGGQVPMGYPNQPPPVYNPQQQGVPMGNQQQFQQGQQQFQQQQGVPQQQVPNQQFQQPQGGIPQQQVPVQQAVPHQQVPIQQQQVVQPVQQQQPVQQGGVPPVVQQPVAGQQPIVSHLPPVASSLPPVVQQQQQQNGNQPAAQHT